MGQGYILEIPLARSRCPRKTGS